MIKKIIYFFIANLMLITGVFLIFTDTRVNKINSTDFIYLSLPQWVLFFAYLTLVLIGFISNIGLLIWFVCQIFFSDDNNKTLTED